MAGVTNATKKTSNPPPPSTLEQQKQAKKTSTPTVPAKEKGPLEEEIGGPDFLFNNPCRSDVIIVLKDGTEMYGHTQILMSWSGFFKTLFSAEHLKDMTNSGKIKMIEYTPKHVRMFIHVLYMIHKVHVLDTSAVRALVPTLPDICAVYEIAKTYKCIEIVRYCTVIATTMFDRQVCLLPKNPNDDKLGANMQIHIKLSRMSALCLEYFGKYVADDLTWYHESTQPLNVSVSKERIKLIMNIVANPETPNPDSIVPIYLKALFFYTYYYVNSTIREATKYHPQLQEDHLWLLLTLHYCRKSTYSSCTQSSISSHNNNNNNNNVDTETSIIMDGSIPIIMDADVDIFQLVPIMEVAKAIENNAGFGNSDSDNDVVEVDSTTTSTTTTNPQVQVKDVLLQNHRESISRMIHRMGGYSRQRFSKGMVALYLGYIEYMHVCQKWTLDETTHILEKHKVFNWIANISWEDVDSDTLDNLLSETVKRGKFTGVRTAFFYKDFNRCLAVSAIHTSIKLKNIIDTNDININSKLPERPTTTPLQELPQPPVLSKKEKAALNYQKQKAMKALRAKGDTLMNDINQLLPQLQHQVNANRVLARLQITLNDNTNGQSNKNNNNDNNNNNNHPNKKPKKE